jgi:hypothetical protein
VTDDEIRALNAKENKRKKRCKGCKYCQIVKTSVCKISLCCHEPFLGKDVTRIETCPKEVKE